LRRKEEEKERHTNRVAAEVVGLELEVAHAELLHGY